MVEVLEVVYDLSKITQKRDLPLADFYRSWIIMKMKLKKYADSDLTENNLAVQLLSSITEREKMIRTPSLLCALYLDGRFSNQLTNSELELVKLRLKDLWERILNLRKEEQQQVESAGPILDNSNELFEQFINLQQREEEIDNRCEPSNHQVTPNQMLISLEDFEKEPRPNLKLTNCEIWQERKIIYPDLYVLASNINAIPPSQASVERSFSAFSLLFSSRRYSLSQNLLEDILCIHFNQDLFEDVCFDEQTRLNEKCHE